ncbi:MAG: TRAP-type mannitol/chloroaromatic compound transport system substrate-binding protein [Gammaproteobacteria bacterium]
MLAGSSLRPVFTGTERGVTEATEFSMPTIDIKFGFHQIAKHNYYPGWHQQVSCREFLMNMGEWKKLPDAYQAMIENSGGAS